MLDRHISSQADSIKRGGIILRKINSFVIFAFSLVFVLAICNYFIPHIRDVQENIVEYNHDAKVLQYAYNIDDMVDVEGKKSSLADDIADDRVDVILKKEYSDIEGDVDEDYFRQIDNVDDIYNSFSVTTKELINQDKFRQILTITLIEKGIDRVTEAIKALNNLEKVLIAQPTFIFSDGDDTVPNDTYYAGQWGLSGTFGIKAPSAWNIEQGDSSMQIGLLEAGLQENHPDLRTLQGSFSSPSETDLQDHGTHVGGIIAAISCNNLGVAGITNATLRLMNWASLPESLSWAASQGISIVNASFWRSRPLIENGEVMNEAAPSAIDYQAISTYNGLFIASAGNQGLNNDDHPQFPAAYDLPNIITVGAISSDGNISDFSNFGAITVDVFAPGSSIMSTISNSGYGLMSGTSMAAPFVTGVAALLKSYKPSLTTAQIKEAIMNSVTPVSGLSGLCVSGGILNAQAALEYVCDHVYGEDSVYIDENEHSVVCTLCGDVKVESHDSKYTSNDSTTHKLSCACGHVEKEAEAHFFIYVGLHGVMQKFECQMCGFTKLENIDVPIVRPDEIIRPIGEFVSDE